MVRVLLFARFRVMWNSLTHRDSANRARTRGGLLFSLLIMGGVGAISYGFFAPFAEAAETDTIARRLLELAPALGLFSSFWLLALSGVTAGIQTFYLNPEMALLLVAPVRSGSLFLAKLAEAILANAALFFTTGAPIVIAYSLALHRLAPGYLFSALLLLIAFSALPTGIGVLAAMVMMRVLPAGKTRDALAAVGVALFAVGYFAISSSVTRVQRADPAALRGTADALLTAASAPLLQHGPWAWAGGALGGSESSVGIWIRVAGVCALAAASIALCAWLAQRLFYAGWAAAQEADSGANGRSGTSVSPWVRLLAVPFDVLAGILTPPVRAVFVKDMTSMKRDMRQLSMLFIPIAVVAVFIANVRTSPQQYTFGPLLFVQTLLVILAPISLRIALAAYVAENRAFWVLMGAPNEASTVLLGKFVFACVLSLPIALLAAAAYAWAAHLPVGELAICLLLVTCVVAAFSGIGVGASARWCDFSADNARFTLSTGGRLAIFGLQIGFMLVMAMLNLAAWALLEFGRLPIIPVLLAEVAVAAGLAAVCVTSSLWWGAARLKKLEW